MGKSETRHFINKQEFITRLTELFEQEEIELIGVDHHFDTDDIVKLGEIKVEHYHTGVQELTIKLLNKNAQKEYHRKLGGG